MLLMFYRNESYDSTGYFNWYAKPRDKLRNV